MRRLDKNEIVLEQDELDSIREFIRSALDREWDRHTDTFICDDKWEDGMRRMNPILYDLAECMGSI